MTLFLSYAHQDLDVVTALRRDLEDLGQTVWLDESLHGGQIWWDEILRQVRQCNGFILAVSARSLESEACLAEWQYAVDLARPFLPVRIDDTEWTGAPDRMRQSQHIDYRPNDADSVKALVRSLGGFAQAAPLPDVLPAPPPTPLSYHERYAKLFAAAPLTFDDQINYFARLTTDVESANSKEALELLTVLRNREDLTVKMGKRIDEYLAQRNIGVSTTVPPPDAPTLDDIDEGGDPPIASSESDSSSPTPAAAASNRRRNWIVAGAAAAAVLIAAILVIALRPTSNDSAAPLVENATCDANNCSDPPIRFLDVTGNPETMTVTITDPYGTTREGSPPTPTKDDRLTWEWSPDYSDPIGKYTVRFDGTDAGTVQHDFTVNAVAEAFGAVQRAGQAIAQRDWDAAAAIDQTIKHELDANGKEFLESKYPNPGQVYWAPYDASGKDNDNGTTIIGAFVSYDADKNTTTAYCELWSVDPGNQTMRSDPLPRTGTQLTLTKTELVSPDVINQFVSEDCSTLTTSD